MKFKLDENLGQSIATAIAELGHDVDTAADENLLSQPDGRIAEAAAREGRVVITLDLDFSDERCFPPGTHPGIIVLRLPFLGVPTVRFVIVNFLRTADLQSLVGAICIIELHRTRIRSAPREERS
jgi:predicted nuclease of predicted toxin-antitoxin system